MKKRIYSIALILVAFCIVALADKHYQPIFGTFSGGSCTYTNGSQPVGISAIYLESSSTGALSIALENLSGYTNMLSPTTVAGTTDTNILSYVDGTTPIPLWRNGKIHLTTTSTNATKYIIYTVDILR